MVKKKHEIFGSGPVILLILVMAAASLHRVGLYHDRPGFDRRSEVGFFFTEEAFQYRYARMIAERQPLPRLDRQAQWPEGLAPHRELTLLQEYLHGMSFRLFSRFFPETPFHIYVICFVSIFSTLAVAALYAGARALGAGPWPALLCAALYAFTGAAFGRVRFYELEATAFPLMAGSFALMLYALKTVSRRRLIFAAGAGVLLAAALITWHFTRFYWLAVTCAYALAFIVSGADRGRFQVFGILFGCVLITGLVSPVMRTAGLVTSPPVIIGAVLLTGLYLDRVRPLSIPWRTVLLGSGAAAALGIALVAGEGSVYGHVWALLKYKLAYFLIKPEDPAALPLAARILWHGPFNTMDPLFLFYRYGLLLPPALAGGALLLARTWKTRDFTGLFLLTMAVGFFVLNLMTRRLTIFGAFFMGLLTAVLFIAGRATGPGHGTGMGSRTEKEKPLPGVLPAGPVSVGRRYLVGGLVVVCLVFQVREAWHQDQTRFLGLLERIFPDQTQHLLFLNHQDELNMLKWVRRHTGEEAVFLSNQEHSPSLLTYADRSIVLHPKFETAQGRDNYIRFLLVLYGEDEEALYRLLREYQVDYYLYPASNLLLSGSESERYVAGLRRLSRRNLTCRLHFDPEGFSGLQLVYRNGFYQIYRVAEESQARPTEIPYYPIFDEALFWPENKAGAKDDDFDDRRAEHVLWRIRHAHDMIEQAEKMAALDNKKETAAYIREAVEVGLPDGGVYYRAADSALATGALRLALSLIRRAVACHPGNTRFREMTARIHLMIGDPDAARPLLDDLRRTIPDDPVIYNYLGIYHWQKGQYQPAREFFGQALKLDPDYETARKNLMNLEACRE